MARKDRLTRRRFLGGALAAGGAAGLALAGCGGDDEDEAATTPPPGGTVSPGEPVRGGVVRSGSSVAIPGLDPHTVEGQIIGPSCYSYVVHATDWQGVVGDVAESWEVIDELTWVFKLRADVKFQDIAPVSGRPLVANDIVYSIDRLRGMPGASTQWDRWAERYEATDDGTLTFVTKKPYGYMLIAMGSPAMAIVPVEAVEEYGDLKNHAIGSGPFMVKDYNRDVQLEQVRNPTYYHEYPYVDGSVVKILSDQAAMQAAYRAGQTDVYNAWTKVWADAVSGVPGTTVHRYLNSMYTVFVVNATRLEAFKDERVREAIDLAIDRKDLIEKLHFGEAEIAGPVPPLWDTALAKEEIEEAYPHDVAKAKQLLSAAGQEDLRFPLLFATVVDAADVAAAIQANLADAGIGTDLDGRELGAWLQAVLAGEAVSTTFAHTKQLTDENALQSQHSHGASRTDREYLGVDDAEVDAMLDKVQETIGDEERKQMAWDLQRQVLKRHGPHFVLFQPYGFWCAYDYLKGYKPTANGFGRYKYDFWIDKG